jgi:transposase
MGEVTTIGLDLAKHVFQVHGVDADGTTVLRKQLRRAQVLTFFSRQPTVWWDWKLVRRPTTGLESWVRSATRCD